MTRHRRGVGALVAGCVVLVWLMLPGCVPAQLPNNGNGNGNGNEPAASQTLTYFEQVWDDFSQSYSHFPDKWWVDWDEVYDRYRPDFVTDLTVAEFLQRLAPMLAELEDLHVNLFDPSGNVVETYTRSATRNYLDNYLPTYFPGGVQRLKNKYPLRHGWMDDDIAYLSIESFEGNAWDGLRTGELDDLFETYAAADGMIVDLRRNSGGAEVIAAAIAGHFTNQSATYAYTRDRTPGDDREAFEAASAHVLQPAANFRYLGPVVLLMGEKNMSSAELFLLMMMEGCPDLWTMGDGTRGSSGNPQEYTLPNGISYLIPSWAAYDVDMVAIEDWGIWPDEWMDADTSYDDALGRDYLLEDAHDTLLWFWW